MKNSRMAYHMARSGIGLKQLAQVSGLNRCGLSLIYNGHHRPRPGTAAKIAAALGVSVSELFACPEVYRGNC